MTTVWVGNLDKSVTEQELSGLFKLNGYRNITKVQITAPKSKKNNTINMAHVYFDSLQSAEAVVRHFNGYFYRGHNLVVSIKKSDNAEENLPTTINNTTSPSIKTISLSTLQMAYLFMTCKKEIETYIERISITVAGFTLNSSQIIVSGNDIKAIILFEKFLHYQLSRAEQKNLLLSQYHAERFMKEAKEMGDIVIALEDKINITDTTLRGVAMFKSEHKEKACSLIQKYTNNLFPDAQVDKIYDLQQISHHGTNNKKHFKKDELKMALSDNLTNSKPIKLNDHKRMSFKAERYYYIKDVLKDLPKHMSSKYSVKVDFNDDEKAIFFKGKLENIRKAQAQLENILRDVKTEKKELPVKCKQQGELYIRILKRWKVEMKKMGVSVFFKPTTVTQNTKTLHVKMMGNDDPRSDAIDKLEDLIQFNCSKITLTQEQIANFRKAVFVNKKLDLNRLNRGYDVEVCINEDDIEIFGESESKREQVVDALEEFLNNGCSSKVKVNLLECLNQGKDPLIVNHLLERKSELEQLVKSQSCFIKIGSLNRGSQMNIPIFADSKDALDKIIKRIQVIADQIEKELITVKIPLPYMESILWHMKNKNLVMRSKNKEHFRKKDKVGISWKKKVDTTGRMLLQCKDNQRNFHISVKFDDLSREERGKKSAIVNASNQDLACFDGVALAIVNRGGNEIKKECQEYVKKNGKVPISSVIPTNSGVLNVCKILHAVSPSFKMGDAQNILRTTYENIFKEASKYDIETLALPVLGSGEGNFPYRIAVETLLSAILQQLSSGTTKVKKIVIASLDTDLCSYLVKRMKEEAYRHGIKDITDFEVNLDLLSVKVVRKDSSSHLPDTSQFETTHQWFWKDDDDQFKEYPPNVNYQIELAYSKKEPECHIITSNDVSRKVIFQEMLQVRTTTGFKRQVKREPIQRTISPVIPTPATKTDSFFANMFFGRSPQVLPTTVKAPTPIPSRTSSTLNSPPSVNRTNQEPTKGTSSISIPKIASNVEIYIRGFERNVKKVKEEMLKFILDNTSTSNPLDYSEYRSVSLDVLAKTLGNISQDDCVDVEVDVAKKTVVFSGACDYVVRAEERFKSEMLKVCYEKSKKLEVQFPKDWEDMDDQNLKLCDVSRLSVEWKKVEDRVRQTLPSAQISKVQRIQNVLLWEKFYREREALARKNGGDANEILLFHGTRGTKPYEIYSSETAFDFRFCSSGWWGRGAYFAVNASYSDSYAFKGLDTSEKQFFLANVVVGEACKMGADSKLNMPPVKVNSSSASTSDRYDSVTGDTEGSPVYVIYCHNRAYPTYLITYK